MQGAPASAVAADDVADVEGLQAFDRLGDEALHDAAQMQASHHRMNREIREQAPDLGTDIDDPRMGAGAEDDQPPSADMDRQEALVHEVGIRLPGGLAVGPAEVVGAALLEGADAGNLAAVVEMA